jgi:16S rRNA (uracil1498-N3)-methyltransferase
MTTIFIPPSDIQQSRQITLSYEKSHYLTNVMRHGRGAKITVIDGCGGAFLAEVQSVQNGVASVGIIGELALDTEPSLNIVLCQSLIKGDKMDFVIHKSTELGVKQIVLLITERVVVKETRKLKRWRKIAEEAAEQCGRTVIPTIHEPVTIGNFFSGNGLIKDNQVLGGFIFWEEGGESLSRAFEKMVSDRKALDCLKSGAPVYVIIGPEGGLTQDEVSLAEEKGFIKTTLGKRLLKSETASIAALAIVQFLLEEFFHKGSEIVDSG